MMTQQTNRTEQRSKYNNVGVVSDRQFHGETVYLKAAHDLRGKSYWRQDCITLLCRTEAAGSIREPERLDMGVATIRIV